MGVLDFLRGAIEPTVAARTGYLQGQEQQRMREAAMRRQGLLDSIKAQLDASEISRNRAMADRAERTPTEPVVQTQDDDGNVVYVPRSQAPGKKAPPRAGTATRIIRPNVINPQSGMVEDIYSDGSREEVRQATPDEIRRATSKGGAGGSAEERLKAQSAYDRALKGVPRPSKTPAQIANPAVFNNTDNTKDIKKLPISIANPARAKVESDSLAYERNTLAPLRQHLMDVTVPGVLDDSSSDTPDGSNAGSGIGMTATSRTMIAPKPTAAAPAADPTTAVQRARTAAMQAEFDRAAQAYQFAKAAGDQSADAKYQLITQKIASKYGQTN